MPKVTKSATVPKTMQEKFDRITAITDAFAQEHLDDEYAELMRLLTAALCRKRPSPLASGTDKVWACGIAHAIGMVNFLFDSTQKPHISANDLYAWFDVSGKTGQGKSKQIRDALKMSQMDPDWWRPSRMNDNSMAWLISWNGFMVDARSIPYEFQVVAYNKGLIPYIPGDAPEGGGPQPQAPSRQTASAQSTRSASAAAQKPAPKDPSSTPPTDEDLKQVYVMGVYIFNGPIKPAFVKKNPVIGRIIEMQGQHTLADLHEAIFTAFDRREQHLYEFQIGGDGPQDPKARHYKPAAALSMSVGDKQPAQDVAKTPIATLGLAEGDCFGYWFDFGDDWWHQVNVEAIQPESGGPYPRVTQRIGASPPQYA